MDYRNLFSCALMIVGAFVFTAVICGVLFANQEQPTPEQCYEIRHMEATSFRFNKCTGESHIVVRGPNGFEWQRVIE